MTGEQLEEIIAVVQEAVHNSGMLGGEQHERDPRADDECIALTGDIVMGLRARGLTIYRKRTIKPFRRPEVHR